MKGPETFKTISLEIVEILVQITTCTCCINDYLGLAAYYNRKDLVDFLIEKGADDWELGMIGAIEGDNYELVEFFISKGANHWCEFMERACVNNQKNIIELLIPKASYVLCYGMGAAINCNNIELIKFLIDKGFCDWNWAIQESIRICNKDLVLFFIENNSPIEWDDILRYVAECGDKDLIEFIIEEYTNHQENHNFDHWQYLMQGAAKGGHKELVEFYIDKIHESGSSIQVNLGLCHAAASGSQDLVDFFIEQGGDDWEEAKFAAMMSNNDDLIYFLTEKCTNH